MINNKKIVILSIILVVLLVCVVATVMFVKTTNTDGNGNTDVQNSEDVASVDIFTGDYNSLSEIEIITPVETLKFYAVGKYLWLVDGIEQSKTDTSKTYVLSMFLSNLKGKSLVEENAKDLLKYGLKQPKYIINAKFGDETVSFYGGNKTPLDDGYYFKTSTSDNVYTLYSSDFETLFSDNYYYRHIPIFNFKSENVEKINISKENSTLVFQSMEEPIVVNNVLYADWEMILPSYNTLDLKMFSENILDKLSYISFDGIVRDGYISDKELTDTQYANIVIENKDGSKKTFKISPLDSENYYVKVDNDPWVYFAPASRFDFVDVTPFKLVNKFIHFFAFNDLSSFVVKQNDKTYNCTVEENGDVSKYFVNGNEIEKQKFNTDVFQNIIGLLATDLCSDASYSKPDVTIEYHLKNGEYGKAELVPLNERNYAVFKDNKCCFAVLKKDVESMLKKLNSLE